MKHWMFMLECIDGGLGKWGNTGQIASMTAKGDTPEEASKLVQRRIPGGWKYTCLGLTKKTYYLGHHQSREEIIL